MSGKRYAGNHPVEGWKRVGSVEDESGRWVVYLKPQVNPVWVTVKVCSAQKVLCKGNYWLAWSGSRFGVGGDMLKLAEHRPTLLVEVRKALVQHEARDLL